MKNLVGAEPDLQKGRYGAPGHATDDAQRQHHHHDVRRLPGGKVDRYHAGQQGADNELSFGTDVPDIGGVADGKAGPDEDEGCCLDDQLLARPVLGQRLDEIDIERLEGIEAAQREDDAPGDDGERQGNEGREDRHAHRLFGALLKHQPHGAPL